MRRFKIMVLAVLMMVGSVMTVSAHPARNVQLSFNKETGELTVVLTHPVVDRSAHYIKTIEVRVNNLLVHVKPLTGQEKEGGLTYTVKLDNVAVGAVIEVATVCSRSGSSRDTVSVE